MSSLSTSANVGKVDADQLLTSIGSFGLFQKFFYLLLCLPCAISAYLTLSPVFTAAVPKYRCRIPACDLPDSSYQDAFLQQYSNFTIPVENGEPSNCRSFVEAQQSSPWEDGQSRCDPQHFSRNVSESCNAFIFDETVYLSTIVTDFQLTCDQAWKIPLAQSAFFASLLASAAVLGHLADRFGRKVVLMISIAAMASGGCGLALVQSYGAYVGVQIIGAVGQLGTFSTAFIIGVELVGRDRRVLCGIVIEYFFVLGEALVALVAWRERAWRTILLCVMAPSLCFLAYWPFLPESLRWLLAKKKEEEALVLARRIATWNRKSSLPTSLDSFRELELNPQDVATTTIIEEDGLRSALRSKTFLFRTFIICFCWSVIAMTYYGLSLNSASLAGDPYLNFLLVALVELPGYTLSYFSMERFGRRPSVAASLIVGGLSILVDPFVPENLHWAKIFLFLLGKLCVTCAFGTIYLYSSELAPTRIRSAFVGVSSTFGRFGAIVSPYVGALASTQKWLPMVFFGGFAVLGGGLVLLLPETLGRDLPDTLSEALDLSRPSVVAVGSRDYVAEPIDENDETRPLLAIIS